ncbi:sulfotransferase family 2 domain-containing protein [Planktotalea sp.]|uniref:sulfotransferase family 2 domain-containing protein n=1 Tax=Planktotalea sp. TaxID=2029877 RepID=UPI003F6D7333
MFDTAPLNAPIVFLHIPKTAGQTVHNELARAVGQRDVSPVRVHAQATSAETQLPFGYRLYSGHIDWLALDQIQKPRFVFSIFRDPRERIASFYFYLLKEAKLLSAVALEHPHNIGKKTILNQSVDDYFFGDDQSWQTFIHDHYDNFYCRYLATQKIRAGSDFSALPKRRKLRAALRNLNKIDWIYSLENLSALEDDLNALYGFDLDFSKNQTNTGDRPATELRWPRLLNALERDQSKARLESFVSLDIALMDRLEL